MFTAFTNNILISPIHVPREHNILADYLSKGQFDNFTKFAYINLPIKDLQRIYHNYDDVINFDI